jgi:fructose-bisphosphate aldolase class II
MDLDATACAESVLTEPEEVARFVEETGVDALAVSIGTAHGVYRSLPTLNIERLKELNAASPVPLVLHGGSGTPDDQIQASVRNGVCKLNIYADCRIAMGRGLKQAAASLTREDPLPPEIFGPIKQGVSKVVAAKIRLLFAENRAWNPGATA